MKVLKKIINAIDTVNLWAGKIGAWSIIVLTLLIVYEVVSRRVFSSPTIWTYETITMVYSFHFMIVAGYALLHKSLVSVDLLYERFSIKIRAILDLVTYTFLFFPFVVGVLYVSSGQAMLSWAIKETSSSLFGAPVYLTKTIIPIAFGLLALQGVSEVLKRIVVLVRRESI